jgi:ribosomal protein S18 acetylase RimI-like enzyme
MIPRDATFVRMRLDPIIAEEIPTLDELVELYSAVGWTAYTRDPDQLLTAFFGSTLVLTARDAEGSLYGIARALSDGVTICYVQDLVVEPNSQRQGVGAALLSQVMSRYEGCRQIFLTTDADGPLDFYRGLGFVRHEELGLVALGQGTVSSSR